MDTSWVLNPWSHNGNFLKAFIFRSYIFGENPTYSVKTLLYLTREGKNISKHCYPLFHIPGYRNLKKEFAGRLVYKIVTGHHGTCAQDVGV